MDAQPQQTKDWEKEATILKQWIKVSKDRLAQPAQARAFFRYYDSKDLLWARPGFDFWKQAFVFLTTAPSAASPASKDKSESDVCENETRRLKTFCKRYLLCGAPEQAIANSKLNVVQCGMRFATNCWRNCVYALRKGPHQPELWGAALATKVAFGLLDEEALVNSVVSPFMRECAVEMGLSLEDELQKADEWEADMAARSSASSE